MRNTSFCPLARPFYPPEGAGEVPSTDEFPGLCYSPKHPQPSEQDSEHCEEAKGEQEFTQTPEDQNISVFFPKSSSHTIEELHSTLENVFWGVKCRVRAHVLASLAKLWTEGENKADLYWQ